MFSSTVQLNIPLLQVTYVEKITNLYLEKQICEMKTQICVSLLKGSRGTGYLCKEIQICLLETQKKICIIKYKYLYHIKYACFLS